MRHGVYTVVSGNGSGVICVFRSVRIHLKSNIGGKETLLFFETFYDPTMELRSTARFYIFIYSIRILKRIGAVEPVFGRRNKRLFENLIR